MRRALGLAVLVLAAPIIVVVELLTWLDDWQQDDDWQGIS